MPNWTKNELLIQNSDENINNKQILRKICTYSRQQKKYRLDFNKIIPMPKTVFSGRLDDKAKKKYGLNNWYDWRCKNWGVKWNACDTIVHNDDESITIEFQTPWSPPLPVIDQMKKMFKNYDIYICGCYIGEGYEFAGVFNDG
jgi:hypothetical protein